MIRKLNRMSTRFLAYIIIIGMMLGTMSKTMTLAQTNYTEVVYDDITVKVHVLEDNEEVKQVVTEDDTTITTSNFDKVSNILEVTMENKLTSEIDYVVIDLNSDGANDNSPSQLNRSSSSKFSRTTPLGYVYTSGSNWWGIWDSDNNYKGLYETSSNSTNLLSFRSSVNSLVSYEAAMIASLGTIATSLIVAGATAPTGLGAAVAIVTALGGSISLGYTYWSACQVAKDADFYYSRI